MKHCYMGASTARVVHSTKAAVDYMDEMNGVVTRNGMEVKNTKEGVQTRRDEQGVPNMEWMCSSQGFNMHGMTLACPATIAKARDVSFDLCRRDVYSPLQFPYTQLLVQVDKGTHLWDVFLHRPRNF